MATKQPHSNDRATLALFWRASIEHKRLFWQATAYPVGSIFTGTVAPLFVGKTLAALGHSGTHPLHYLVYFAIAAALGILGNRYGFRAFLKHQVYTNYTLQSLALNTLLKRSVGFHNDNVGGKLVSDAIDFPQAFSVLDGALFADLLPLVSILVTGSILVFWASWEMGLVVIAMSVYAIGSGVLENRQRAKFRGERLAASKELTSHMADTISNMQTVKTFAHEDREMANNDELALTVRRLRLRDWTIAANRGSTRIAVLSAMQLLFAFTVIKLVQQNPALLGIGIFAFSFTITLFNRLFQVNTITRNIEDSLLQAAPMTEIILGQPEVVDQPDAQSLKVSAGHITLNNVAFTYQEENSAQAVFHGLSLDVAPGEKIGLVGPSGGGKSTLTRLLLRFEDINSGEILIDGQNIAQVTQSSLRKAISYVPQEPLLFHRPIDQNIAYGNPAASAPEIVKAARAAHANDFIRKLPHGYETVVGERGVKLSGGQRQRVAIARAILKDAPLLILDEATSALDSESEVFIQEALWQLMKKRTTIVIAHRLSTIQRMDRIVVLDQGRIVEQGTHRDLLKQKGLYAKLWAHQSGGFIED